MDLIQAFFPAPTWFKIQREKVLFRTFYMRDAYPLKSELGRCIWCTMIEVNYYSESNQSLWSVWLHTELECPASNKAEDKSLIQTHMHTAGLSCLGHVAHLVADPRLTCLQLEFPTAHSHTALQGWHWASPPTLLLGWLHVQWHPWTQICTTEHTCTEDRRGL